MKKTLGLLALTVAVSSVSLAEQDFVKSLSLDVQGGYTYVNQKNPSKNGGFKKVNRTKTKFVKTLAGSVVLSNEAGLEADFSIKHENGHDVKAGTRSVKVSPELALKKSVNLGGVDTTFKVGYKGEVSGTGEAKSYENTFFVNPSFKVHGVDIETKVAYTKKPDGKVWGADLNLGYGDKLVEGDFGKVEYHVALNNEFRKMVGVKGSKYTVKFNPSVTYTTPTFAGFMGSVKVSDEVSKETKTKGYENNFKVTLNADYKNEIETAVGKVVVKPYVSYDVVNITKKKLNKATQENELRAGLKLSLEK